MLKRVTNLTVMLALALGLFACQAGPTNEPSQPAPVATQAPGEQPQPTQPGGQPQPVDPGQPAPTQPPNQPAPTGKQITLITSGFTVDTGVVRKLTEDFTARTGIPVVVDTRVNQHQVLEAGMNGEGDVLLSHAPEVEASFIEKGYGTIRYLIMHTDFIIVGPAADPAAVKGSKNSVQAFQKIAAAQAPYASRADNSVVERLESYFISRAKITKGAWFFETGQGMFETLVTASERSAYTLTDRQSFLLKQSAITLVPVLEGDQKLLNYYHVIVLNPAKFPTVNAEGARAFADYLLTPEAQQIIAEFNVQRLGQPVFFPDGGKTDAELGLPEPDTGD